MASKRRDSELSSELYFSVKGDTRKLKPQKIKSYAFYKPLENIAVNNFVVAVDETNEIFVYFKEKSESKVFTLDKVFHKDISQDELHLLTKSAIQDIIMGLNSFLILYKLAHPVSSKVWFKMDLYENIVTNVLKDLLLFVNKEENMDCSLHVSYFEMHGDKIIDLLSECDESGGLEMHVNLRKEYFAIKGLVDKSVIGDKDILELFSRQPHSSSCIAACCHLIFVISMVRRNINNDGLEFIQIGKLTLVSPGRCNSCLENGSPNTDDCLMKCADQTFLPSSEYKILNILKPALGGNATTTIICLLSSVLYSPEKDLNSLQFLSEIRDVMTHPEINLQLITRNSLKEYAEEVKELKKYLHFTSKGIGIRMDHLLYRSFQNSLAHENEIVKDLEDQVLGLNDSIDLKKQKIIALQTALKSKETEIREVENASENLEFKGKKIKIKEFKELNDNIKQKVHLKAAENVAMKQRIISSELNLKKLKLDIRKAKRNFEELTRSNHFLKNETAAFLSDVDALNTFQKSTLELLIVEMNNTYSQFQSLENDLITKLNDLMDIDAIAKKWKDYAESFAYKFSSFVQEESEHLASIKLEMSTLLAHFHVSKYATADRIRNNWSDKAAAMNDYFKKLWVFCESSFKIITEITRHMAEIESCYKVEFKAIAAAFGSTSDAFKKIITDINVALKSFQPYFEEQEKMLLKLADEICFHQKFKKQLDEQLYYIKQCLCALKQMCLEYHDSSYSKWNEIQKGWQKTILKHNDLLDHLSFFQTDISKYLDNLVQQKWDTLEYSPLNRNTDYVESHLLQLLQMHKEMKDNLGQASEVHKKGIDEESLEIEKHLSLQMTEIEKYFDIFAVKLKDSTNYFLDELRNMHQFSSSTEDEFEKDLDSLSDVSHFNPIFHSYPSTFNSILTKSEQSFKDMPSVCEDKNDSILDFDNLVLEEWQVVASTPNVTEKKEFNTSQETEKLICRIRTLAEQQVSQKPSTSILDYEKKGATNVSTRSLPSLGRHSKGSIMTEESFPRLKSNKK